MTRLLILTRMGGCRRGDGAKSALREIYAFCLRVSLAGVPEDSEEVAGSSGGNEQMPDEMAITELLG